MEYTPESYPGIGHILDLAREFVEDVIYKSCKRGDYEIDITSDDSATTIDSQDSDYDPTYVPSLCDMGVDEDDTCSLSSEDEDVLE